MVDKNELSRLLEEAHKENQKNTQIIKEYIQAKTDKTLRIRTSIYYYCESPMEICVNVEFIKEDGKSDFGSDFDMYYRPRHYKETSEFSMGCGTIGSYTRKEEPYQIDRMRLMLNLWDSEDELVTLFNSLSQEANRAAEKLQRQLEHEEYEAERLAEEKRKQEVIDSIKVGYTFSDKDKKHYYDYTITKITPKRVYLDYVENYETSHYVWKGNVCTGEQFVLAHTKKSGYIEYDTLVYILANNDDDRSNVFSYVKGVNWLGTNSENLEFRPCKQN